MIETNTCLVLGAGASVPYGFPSGPELRRVIIERVAKPNDKINTALVQAGYAQVHLNELVKAFEPSRQASIDAFLATRPDLSLVGKAAMAAVLINCEIPEKLLRPKDPADNWLEYVWGHLQRGGQSRFEENRLSVVSFNYDRSLERSLVDAYTHSFGESVDKATEVIARTIPLVKVHGSLGPLSETFATEGARPYGKDLDAQIIRIAASGVKILPEVDTTSDEFEKARVFIRSAEKVIFLGCAYHAENMERLGLEERPYGGARVGTGYGLTERERSNAKAHWEIETGDRSWQSLRFLREMVDLV